MGHRAGGEVSARGGFTLLEVILTLFVLALVVGITLPTIGRSADAIRARADVAGFSAVFRHAREQAITTQRAYAVVVDPAAHSIKIVADEKDVQTRTLPERLTVQALLPPPATVYFQPHGVSSGGEFRVTSGNVAYRVTVDALTGRVKSERM